MTDPTEAIRKALESFDGGSLLIPVEQLRALLDRLDSAEAEVLEQARLNGMGAEREAALLARLDSAERDANLYRELKPRMIGADFDWNESGTCVLVFEWAENVPVGADLDSNIAALRVGAVGGEG